MCVSVEYYEVALVGVGGFVVVEFVGGVAGFSVSCCYCVVLEAAAVYFAEELCFEFVD